MQCVGSSSVVCTMLKILNLFLFASSVLGQTQPGVVHYPLTDPGAVVFETTTEKNVSTNVTHVLSESLSGNIRLTTLEVLTTNSPLDSSESLTLILDENKQEGERGTEPFVTEGFVLATMTEILADGANSKVATSAGSNEELIDERNSEGYVKTTTRDDIEGNFDSDIGRVEVFATTDNYATSGNPEVTTISEMETSATIEDGVSTTQNLVEEISTNETEYSLLKPLLNEVTTEVIDYSTTSEEPQTFSPTTSSDTEEDWLATLADIMDIFELEAATREPVDLMFINDEEILLPISRRNFLFTTFPTGFVADTSANGKEDSLVTTTSDASEKHFVTTEPYLYSTVTRNSYGDSWTDIEKHSIVTLPSSMTINEEILEEFEATTQGFEKVENFEEYDEMGNSGSTKEDLEMVKEVSAIEDFFEEISVNEKVEEELLKEKTDEILSEIGDKMVKVLNEGFYPTMSEETTQLMPETLLSTEDSEELDVWDYLNISTEISVVETINGEKVERKLSDAERLLKNKLRTGRSSKNLHHPEETSEPNDLEELSSFLEIDHNFLESITEATKFQEEEEEIEDLSTVFDKLADNSEKNFTGEKNDSQIQDGRKWRTTDWFKIQKDKLEEVSTETPNREEELFITSSLSEDAAVTINNLLQETTTVSNEKFFLYNQMTKLKFEEVLTTTVGNEIDTWMPEILLEEDSTTSSQNSLETENNYLEVEEILRNEEDGILSSTTTIENTAASAGNSLEETTTNEDFNGWTKFDELTSYGDDTLTTESSLEIFFATIQEENLENVEKIASEEQQILLTTVSPSALVTHNDITTANYQQSLESYLVNLQENNSNLSEDSNLESTNNEEQILSTTQSFLEESFVVNQENILVEDTTVMVEETANSTLATKTLWELISGNNYEATKADEYVESATLSNLDLTTVDFDKNLVTDKESDNQDSTTFEDSQILVLMTRDAKDTNTTDNLEEEITENDYAISENLAASTKPELLILFHTKNITFNVKISVNQTSNFCNNSSFNDGFRESFYIPSDAYHRFEDNNLNITWQSSVIHLNNSLTFGLSTINYFVLKIVKDDVIYTYSRLNDSLRKPSDPLSPMKIKMTCGIDLELSNTQFWHQSDKEPEVTGSYFMVYLYCSFLILSMILLLSAFAVKKVRDHAGVFKPSIALP